MHLCPYAYINYFIYTFIHAIIYLCIYLFIPVFIYTFIYAFIYLSQVYSSILDHKLSSAGEILSAWSFFPSNWEIQGGFGCL